MSDQNSSSGRIIPALLLFALAAWISVVLWLCAAVVWLTAVTGSFILSTLALGTFFALTAVAIYRISVRKALHRLHEQAETLYEAARIARRGYEWLAEKWHWLLALWNTLRDTVSSNDA